MMMEEISIFGKVALRKLPRWDFLPGGLSGQHTSPGAQRRVYSVVGPEGSHRGHLHISEYEFEAIRAAMKRAVPSPLVLQLCEQTHTVLKAGQPYIFEVDEKCPHCRELADRYKKFEGLAE